MQIYDFTVAVNGQRQLDAPGNYFYYYSGSAGGADQTITLRGVSSGLRIVLKNGQSLRLPKGQAAETSWYIGNYANQATIIGAVIVGNGEIQDNRIQGSVEVVDGGKNRTYLNQAFIGIVGASVPAGGIFASIALKNPAANTKNLILKTITASSASAISCNYGKFANGLAITANDIAAQSKMTNGGVSSGLLQWDSTTYAAALTANLYGQLTFLANARDSYKFDEPIVINPGQSVRISANTAAIAFAAGFEWFEESAT